MQVIGIDIMQVSTSCRYRHGDDMPKRDAAGAFSIGISIAGSHAGQHPSPSLYLLQSATLAHASSHALTHAWAGGGGRPGAGRAGAVQLDMHRAAQGSMLPRVLVCGSATQRAAVCRAYARRYPSPLHLLTARRRSAISLLCTALLHAGRSLRSAPIMQRPNHAVCGCCGWLQQRHLRARGGAQQHA